MIAEGNKRRTVTRADISQAAGQSDMFDFLIDFLPPDQRKGSNPNGSKRARAGSSSRGPRRDGEAVVQHDEKKEDHSPCLPEVGAPRRAPKGAKKSQANSVTNADAQPSSVRQFPPP